VKQLNLANIVTIARMLFIPVFLVVLLGQMPEWGPWLAAALFTLLAITDAVDGYLARSRNQITTFGKFMDPLADKLLVTAALVALVELGTLPAWIAIIIISRELIVTGLRMVAVAEGVIIPASKWGKVKTVFQIIAIVMFIIMGSTADVEILGIDVVEVVDVLAWPVMVVAVVLTLVSMVDYIYHARDVLTGPWTEDGT
jgi:CDP-diacylglycerol--glycerol-3-phosphate 3-phosphatidyltransferase